MSTRMSMMTVTISKMTSMFIPDGDDDDSGLRENPSDTKKIHGKRRI